MMEIAFYLVFVSSVIAAFLGLVWLIVRQAPSQLEDEGAPGTELDNRINKGK